MSDQLKSPITSGMTATDHIRCGRTRSHYNDPSLTPLSNDPPHPPAKRRGRGKGKVDEVVSALREAAAEKPNDEARRFAIERVLRPLATQRRLDAPSLVGALNCLADWISAQDLSSDEARMLVDKVLAERRATVKPADVTDAVKLAISSRPATADRR